MFQYLLWDRMFFFSSLPLTCVLGVSLPSTHRANTFTPFLWGSPLTTSQLCHAGAAPTRQIIYQKDMGNSLRSAVVSALLCVSSRGKGPSANLVSCLCSCSVGGHQWEHCGWCSQSVGLLPCSSCLLVFIHLKWVPQDLGFSRQNSTGYSPEGSLSFLKQRQMGFVIIWSTS